MSQNQNVHLDRPGDITQPFDNRQGTDQQQTNFGDYKKESNFNDSTQPLDQRQGADRLGFQGQQGGDYQRGEGNFDNSNQPFGAQKATGQQHHGLQSQHGGDYQRGNANLDPSTQSQPFGNRNENEQQRLPGGEYQAGHGGFNQNPQPNVGQPQQAGRGLENLEATVRDMAEPKTASSKAFAGLGTAGGLTGAGQPMIPPQTAGDHLAHRGVNPSEVTSGVSSTGPKSSTHTNTDRAKASGHVGTGDRIVGKVEAAIGSMVGSESMKTKGIEKQTPAVSTGRASQGVEPTITDAERRDHDMHSENVEAPATGRPLGPSAPGGPKN